jgi:hypothetical protein
MEARWTWWEREWCRLVVGTVDAEYPCPGSADAAFGDPDWVSPHVASENVSGLQL